VWRDGGSFKTPPGSFDTAPAEADRGSREGETTQSFDLEKANSVVVTQ